MPRYILDVPRTENDQIVEIAQLEDVSPRTILVWMVKAELAKRLRAVRARSSVVTSAA